MDGAFVSKAIVTDCVIDASANSRLTGRALIVDDLSKKKKSASAGGSDGWGHAAMSDIEREERKEWQPRCQE